ASCVTENQPLWTKGKAIAPAWSKVGIADMNLLTRSTLAAVLAAPLFVSAAPAEAGIGDLLVAPTRIVLDGRSGAEIVLNNIGEEPAVYRVCVALGRVGEGPALSADSHLWRDHPRRRAPGQSPGDRWYRQRPSRKEGRKSRCFSGS